MKKIRKLILAVAVLLAVTPASAVFNEKDLNETISVLRYELKQDYVKLTNVEDRFYLVDNQQHEKMVEILKRCNELALMLYSQGQDCTFDMTYALGEVTNEYNKFNADKMPYDLVLESLNGEVERYSRLIESLRRLPPVLKDVEELPDSLKYHNDSLNFDKPLNPYEETLDLNDAAKRRVEEMRVGHSDSKAANHLKMYVDSLSSSGNVLPYFLNEQAQQDRDSCIKYASTLLLKCIELRDVISKDNEFYEEASARLKESYDYAQDRYRELQRDMFEVGQDNYFNILKYLRINTQEAHEDNLNKYSSTTSEDEIFAESEWRGPKVIGFMGMVLFYLFFATCVAVLVFAILSKKSKKIKTEEFRYRLPVISVLCGTVLFAITATVLSLTVKHNFLAVASKQLLVLSWLLSAIMASMLIRLKGKDIQRVIKLYLPIVAVCVFVVTLRIVFLPDIMVNLIFPPLMLLCFIWQLSTYTKFAKTMSPDSVMGLVTILVFLIATVTAWIGYLFISIEVVIWWLYMEACIETVLALKTLLDNYKASHIEVKKSHSETKGISKVGINWFYDFLRMTALPIFSVMMIPLSIYLAFSVFDMTQICDNIIHNTFDLKDKDGNDILNVSLYYIFLAASLFFVFRYISYIAKSFYRETRVASVTKRKGTKYVRTNEINLTLANNIINIIVWGAYIIMTVMILKIPTGAVSIIAAGLATGLGLAMKDILNNFIYGIQLMSGRLRVGDWMECDETRGRVTAISYQSTQMETLDGAIMSFPNASLFNKNFKNLTRNNSYEFVKILVGVNYGADVQYVRGVLLEALENIDIKDQYGQDALDRKRGISVVFDDFGDSSVNIAVKQFVLVSQRSVYISQAKEIIYNALNNAGIEIPFPQRDIHVIQ